HELDPSSLAVTRFVYGHDDQPKFYLWVEFMQPAYSLFLRSRTLAAAVASPQTGAIVMMNGLIVSLPECDTRSKAPKTATVPEMRKRNATTTQTTVPTFMWMTTRCCSPRFRPAWALCM